MQTATRFGAPWGLLLTTMTALGVLILGGVAAYGIAVKPANNVLLTILVAAPALAILVITLFFMIRGYVVTPDKPDEFVARLKGERG